MHWKRTLIASSLMLLSVVCLRYLSHAENIEPRKPFSTFPKVIGEWVGKEDRFDQEIYDILGVDDSYLGNYYSPDGRHMNLYIGFYQSQKEGEIIHSPKNCMPGAGWNITRTSFEEMQTPGTGTESMKMVKLLLQKGDRKQIMLYWYQSRGRIITSEYFQKIYLVIDSALKHRTDGSFVRLISPVIDGNEEQTVEILKGFARQLVPILSEYIPA